MAKISIELENNRDPQHKTINGIEFLVATPPFLLPDGLEPEVNEEDGTIRIRFQYLGDTEPEEFLSQHGPVSVYVGTITKKILSVVMHVEEFDVGKIKLLITDEVPSRLHEAGKPLSDIFLKDNYSRASQGLVAHAQEVADYVSN